MLGSSNKKVSKLAAAFLTFILRYYDHLSLHNFINDPVVMMQVRRMEI